MKANRFNFRAWDPLGRPPCLMLDWECMDYTLDFLRGSEMVLMQSTGLTDKNGVEIFEGDILQVRLNDEWDSEKDHVEMYAGCWHWRGYTVNSIAHESEVIGNIHENPELLEPCNE